MRRTLWLGVYFFRLLLNGAAQNRVLQLGGKDSYVELPPNVFKDLEDATAEG